MVGYILSEARILLRPTYFKHGYHFGVSWHASGKMKCDKTCLGKLGKVIPEKEKISNLSQWIFPMLFIQ